MEELIDLLILIIKMLAITLISFLPICIVKKLID